MAEQSGVPFGRYELMERVAMGGMAEVFRARTLGGEGFSKEVCIKRILPHFCGEEEFVRMFIDEAMVASKLQHANIVQIFDFDQVDGSYYIAMEYVVGKDLRSVIKQGVASGNLPGPVRSALIAAEMCKGLHYAHNKDTMGLVHRDISPHNVLISNAGEVKVMDFGIAKAADRITRTSTGIIKGKIPYMAPEQAGGADLDHRVDQFATGLVLFEMLTGRRAYEGAEPTALRKALEGEVEPPSLTVPDTPPELDEIFLKMTARDPTQRYADMRGAERALTQFIYSRAPEDAELDLMQYMTALFGAERRARTAVLASVSATRQPQISRSNVDAAAATAQPDLAAVQGAARQESTRTHGGEPGTVVPVEAAAAAVEAPRPRIPLIMSGLLLLGSVSAGVTWMVVRKAPVAPLVETRPADPPPAVIPPPDVAPSAPPPDEDPAPARAPKEPTPHRAVAVPEEPADRKAGRGKVEIRTTGRWAHVYFRGKMILEETPGTVELPGGRQTITLVNPETGVGRKVNVDVQSGATTKFSAHVR